jgi:hypothetical protein
VASGGQGFPGVLVDDVEEADLPAVDGDIDLEVQRPHLIRSLSAYPLMPGRATPLVLPHPGRALQPQLDPQSSGAFAVDHEPFPDGDSVRFTPSPRGRCAEICRSRARNTTSASVIGRGGRRCAERC